MTYKRLWLGLADSIVGIPSLHLGDRGHFIPRSEVQAAFRKFAPVGYVYEFYYVGNSQAAVAGDAVQACESILEETKDCSIDVQIAVMKQLNEILRSEVSRSAAVLSLLTS